MPVPPPVNPAIQEDEAHSSSSNPGELDLFAFYVLLRNHKRRILLCAVAATILMAAFTLLVKPRFVASASIIIPQPSPTASASLALQAVAGLDLVGGGNEIYLDILKSRTVADRLITQFDLKTRYKTNEIAKAEAALASRTVTSAAKEGLLQVSVEDEDPKMAADLANAYLAELDHENQQLAIGSAGQQRRFYEQEMIKEKDALANAEIALKLSEEKNGILEPGLQVQANLGATETTRAQLRARQVELGALSQGATPQNPEVIRVKSEIASLESQLHALESQGGSAAGTPTAKAPEAILAHVRNAREVKFHEALFELLSRQYATAKEQEAKNVSMVQILDRATPPERKAWPPRTLYCLAAFLVGGFLGMAWTALEKLFRIILHNPENQARLRPSAAEPTTPSQRAG